MSGILQAVVAGGAYGIAPMVRTGAVGTIALNATGYQLSGFDNNTYAYLNAPRSAGKWYWEAVVQDFIFYGVTDTPTTNRTFGGYTSNNAGIYKVSSQIWDQYDSPPSWGITNIAVSDILGFALDVGGKTLKIYNNNALGATVLLTSISLPVYPLFAFQSAPTGQIKLGPSGCTYTPPSGYNYI